MAVYSDVTSKLAELALFAEKEKLKVTLYSIITRLLPRMQGAGRELNPSQKLTGWTQEHAWAPLPKVFNIYNEVTGEPCENIGEGAKTAPLLGTNHHSQV